MGQKHTFKSLPVAIQIPFYGHGRKQAESYLPLGLRTKFRQETHRLQAWSNKRSLHESEISLLLLSHLFDFGWLSQRDQPIDIKILIKV